MKQIFLLISLLFSFLSIEIYSNVPSINVITGEYCESQADFSPIGKDPIMRSFTGSENSNWQFNIPGENFTVSAQKLILNLSDNQQLTYQLLPHENLLIEKVFLSDTLLFHYHYTVHPLSGKPLIERRDEADGSFLINEYYPYDPKDPLSSWRAGKIKSQRAPVGHDATPITIFSFIYYPHYTEVYDAYHNKSVYHHKHENLTSIEHYVKDELDNYHLYRKQRFFWQNDQSGSYHLISKSLEDSEGKVLCCQIYEYNPEGQAIKETLYGNLTGKCQIPIQLQENGKPINNGVESYSIYRQYSPEAPYLLMSQSADNGSRTIYQYEHSRLSAEFFYFGKKIYSSRFYHYDENGNLLSLSDENGKTRPLQNTLPLQEVKSSHEPICFYDLAKRIIRKEEVTAEGKTVVTSYRYDYKGNQVSSLDTYGNETQFEYDDLGRLIKVIFPSVPDASDHLINPTTHYFYDIFDRLIKSVDPKGYETQIQYNVRGKPIEIRYPDGTTEIFEYALDGSLIKVKNKTGQHTLYTHDAAGRVILREIYDANDQLQGCQGSLFDAGRLVSTTDFGGMQTTYTYDELGRQISVEKKGQNSIRKSEQCYDSKGNITQYEWWGNGSQEYTQSLLSLNSKGQPNKSQIQDASGKILRELSLTQENPPEALQSYEEEQTNRHGQLVSKRIVIDKQGNLLITTFDALGRREEIERKNSLGKTVWKQEMRYDACGNKTRQITSVLIDGQQQRLNIDTWEYGPNNRLEAQTEALGSSLQKQSYFTYNSYGQLESYIKPDGVSLNHLYHPTGQISDYFSSDGSFYYRYTYDANNHIIEVKDLVQNTSTKRTYNQFNELITEKLANGLLLSSSYDLQGRRTSLILPDSSSVHYEYDAANLKTLCRYNEAEKLLYQCDYLDHDLQGNVKAICLIGRAGEVDYLYDTHGHCQAIHSNHWKEEIDYDDNGSIRTIQHTDPKGSLERNFNYDDSRRLTHERGLTNASFAYDSLSNRILDQGSTNEIDELNQLTFSKDCRYDYDLRGNRLMKKDPQETLYYRYDALDRLIEINKENDFSLHFSYDAFHRRLSKTIYRWNSNACSWEEKEKWHYLYDGDKEIGMTDNQGKLLELRILGSGRGAEIGSAIAHELQGKIYAPIHDHQGSVVCLVDAETGSPAEFYRYTAFGEEEIFSENGEKLTETAINNCWRFSSKRKDSDTGLIYYGKRYYDPAIGRWLTKDPMGSIDNLNPFIFLNNDPLGHHDLYGLFTLEDGYHFFNQKKNECLKAFSQFVTKVNKVIYHDLSYVSYIKREMETMAGNIFGKGFLQFSGYYGDNRPFTGSYGHKEINEKVRVTLINGILNVKNDFLANLRFFSEIHGNTKIHYVFYPTEGWTRDMVSCLFVKLGFVTYQARMMADTWKKLIEEMGGVDGGGIIFHYAHSIGATHTYVAKNLLTPEEQKMIRVITLGSPTMIPNSPSGFASVINYVSKRDGVCLLDPLGLLNGWFLQDSNVVFIGSFMGMPIVDHPLTTQNYTEILKNLGKQFFESYAPSFYTDDN